MTKRKTKAEILIGELKNHPNWQEMYTEELLEAIKLYEWMGARWNTVEAFEEENYHDIAEAINDEMRIEALQSGKWTA